MMTTGHAQFETARVYHDFNSLGQLKNKGKDDNPAAIREAARQFESIFMRMMLKSMRDANTAIIDEPLFGSSQMDLYKDMHDDQLSLHLSSTKSGLGLTDILVQQLTGNPASSSTKNNIQTSFNPQNVPKTASAVTYKEPNVEKHILARLDAEKVTTEETTEKLFVNKLMKVAEHQPTADVTSDERGIDFSTPVAFVQSLWAHAEQAAKNLQVDPKVLIAQAALETGWGKFVMRTAEGASSKNLFGIKSSSDWQGEKTQVTTLELEGGALSKKKAEFRAYSTYADSFADYVEFIKGKTRYQKARDVSVEADNYARELQSAGYATDPNYADKIGRIYNSSLLSNAIKAVVSRSGF